MLEAPQQNEAEQPLSAHHRLLRVICSTRI